MKLLEALKTGKRIKPFGGDGFGYLWEWHLSQQRCEACDWEVEPEPKKQRRVFLWEFNYNNVWVLDTRWMNEKDAILTIRDYTERKYRKSPLCPDGILEDVE